MQPQTSEQLHAWFKTVQPVYAELFNAAYAMCGNYDLAEYALRSALLDVWLQNIGAGMGFRERLRGALRREAFDAALSDEGLSAELDWPGVSPPRDGDGIQALLCREAIDVQRLVMLRYGCGLSPRAIARLADWPQSRVRGELERFEARCRRSLSGADKSRAEALIARRARRILSQGGAGIPHPAQVYRAFEAEAGGMEGTGRRASRVVGHIVMGLTALLCAGAFWLFAVLVQV